MPKRRNPDAPPPVVKKQRDQSLVMKKWWDQKREAQSKLEEEKVALAAEVAALRAEKERLLAESASLEASRREAEARVQRLLPDAEPFVREVENFGGLQKITDKATRLHVVGRSLLSLMAVIMKHTHPITRLRTVCHALFGAAIFGAAVTKDVLSEVYKKYIFEEHRSTFASWRVLRAIDLSPVGGLNFNGVETLRNVEELELYQRGILPARSSIQKASYELYDLGQQHIPFHWKQCDLGEVYQFEFEPFIRFILKTFSLYEIAQRESVELCITLDGAELCDGLSHLTAGIKITDPRAVDPKDGTPLSCMENGLVGRIFKTQSRNYCFAVKSLLGKDSKPAHNEFSDFFKFFEKLMQEGLPASEFGPAILPIIVWSPQDLSSIWKCLNTGSGARKNGNTHFCHLCACTGDTIVRFLVEENR
jgi:hypothetical protein